jgi:hypothetical protein
MTERRKTNGANWRVREAVGVRPSQPQRETGELIRLLVSADFSEENMQRLAEALGQTDPAANQILGAGLERRTPDTTREVGRDHRGSIQKKGLRRSDTDAAVGGRRSQRDRHPQGNRHGEDTWRCQSAWAGRLVRHDDVRALVGVLAMEPDSSKGIITTTSDFAPKIYTNPQYKALMLTRLELVNGKRLQEWLARLAKK